MSETAVAVLEPDVKKEAIEKNKVKLTFAVGAARFEEGLQHAYNKEKSRLNLPGFRPGRAPRKLLEAQFGKEIFYDEAVNFVLPAAYEAAVKETGIKTIDRPKVDVEDVTAEGVRFVAEVFVKPEVTVDGYYALTYKPFDTDPSGEEIDRVIEQDREKNSRLVTVDRPAADGDTVSVDFEGFVDGEPFEGGKGTDYELVLGSHSFIDTFEEQIAGHSAGDDFTVHVVFPENYGSAELAGKAAVFKVSLKEVRLKELPEVNEEFAQDVSEFDTLMEYRNSIADKLKHEKEHQAEHDKENQVMEQLIEKAVMDVPEVMIDNKVDDMIQSMANQMSGQGLSLEMYLQYSGQTLESLMDSYRGQAVMQVKGRLALEAVAEKEKLEAGEEDVDEEIGRMAESYGMEKDRLAAVMRPEDREAMKEDVLVRKALGFVQDKAVAMRE